MISLLLGGMRSGKTTWNSTRRSPRWAGFFARGSPSPMSRLTEPGLMTSLHGSGFICPSSVGTLTVHPHRAWRKNKERKPLNIVSQDHLWNKGLYWFSNSSLFVFLRYDLLYHTLQKSCNAPPAYVMRSNPLVYIWCFYIMRVWTRAEYRPDRLNITVTQRQKRAANRSHFSMMLQSAGDERVRVGRERWSRCGKRERERASEGKRGSVWKVRMEMRWKE